MTRRDSGSTADGVQDRRLTEDVADAHITSRSKMFFAGLSFAILSFMGAHPVDTHSLVLKISETIALISLFGAGTILLLRLENYLGPLTHLDTDKKRIEYWVLSKEAWWAIRKKIYVFIFLKEKSYWRCFILGMGLMIIDRVAVLFLN